MPLPRDCPCGQGLRYAACCQPLHDGVREAETPEALMRSRYAAFVVGHGEYLVRTLSADHDDRAHDPKLLARELGRAREKQRFLGLRVLEAKTSADGREGEVTFTARIFERGVDRSFTERSTFVREGGAWRYARGVLVEGRGSS